MADITVTMNGEEGRFEAHRDGELLGYIDYAIEDGVMDMPHTKVFPQYEGQGVGSSLVKQSLDMVRDLESDLKVKPTCPFIDVYMKRHPEYEDLRV